jgi:hypothetical protein
VVVGIGRRRATGEGSVELEQDRVDVADRVARGAAAEQDVRVREQGCRIESVPLKRLVELNDYRKKRWWFEDGWLILEAF